MNSSFACISILVKINVSKPCLINFLNELSSKSLRYHLKLASIYDGSSNKKKSDLIEMVIYGCINGKLKNKIFDDIFINKAHSMLNKNEMLIKLLPGYGNISKRKKDINLIQKIILNVVLIFNNIV